MFVCRRFIWAIVWFFTWLAQFNFGPCIYAKKRDNCRSVVARRDPGFADQLLDVARAFRADGLDSPKAQQLLKVVDGAVPARDLGAAGHLDGHAVGPLLDKEHVFDCFAAAFGRVD